MRGSQKEELLKILAEMEKQDDEKEDKTAGIAESIAMVEYYYGVFITGKSPLMKRFIQQENLSKFFDFDAKRFGLKK